MFFKLYYLNAMLKAKSGNRKATAIELVGLSRQRIAVCFHAAKQRLIVKQPERGKPDAFAPSAMLKSVGTGLSLEKHTPLTPNGLIIWIKKE
jgi:hypothetical protein